MPPQAVPVSPPNTGQTLAVNKARALNADAPPLVSVVLPAFNAASTLKAALNSLFVQEPAAGCPLPPFEIIVVNDGSTDDSAALLETCAAEKADLGRLRVLHLPHRGIVAALNAGLAAARGSFIARMDADDECLPARLERQVAFLDEHPEIGVCATQVAFGGDASLNRGYALHVEWTNSLLTPEQIALNRFVESPLAHPSVMFRHSLVAEHACRHAHGHGKRHKTKSESFRRKHELKHPRHFHSRTGRGACRLFPICADAPCILSAMPEPVPRTIGAISKTRLRLMVSLCRSCFRRMGSL